MEAHTNPDASRGAAADAPAPPKRQRMAPGRPIYSRGVAPDAPGTAAAPEEEIRRPRILVCAPSNAATDELLSRVLNDKFVDVHGNRYEPKAVRMGSESANMAAEAKRVRRRHACCMVCADQDR